MRSFVFLPVQTSSWHSELLFVGGEKLTESHASHGAIGFAMLFKFVLEASPGELPVVCLETFPNQLAMGTEDGIVDAVR